MEHLLKIAEAADISQEAKTLHETYWKVNWSVKSSLKVWKLKR
jgi:hypothetical protein